MPDNGGGILGSRSFSSLGLLLLKVDIPILPETRQVEEEIPGMDGSLDLETTYGPRPIALTFDFLAKDEIAYQIGLQEIARAFNARAGVQSLILDRMPGKRWLVKYNGTLPIEKLAQLGTFTVPFKAFFPFAESVTDSMTPLQLGQGYTLGMGLRLGMGPGMYTITVTSSPKTFTVYTAGTHDAKPIIRIRGAAGGITMTNATTGESFTWSGTLDPNDTLEIDCGRYDPAVGYPKASIKKNGVNAFAQFGGVYPRLAPGDNLWSITATGPNATIEFIFRHTYLY